MATTHLAIFQLLSEKVPEQFVKDCYYHIWERQFFFKRKHMHLWITKPQRIREWWPSKCHREFGHGTEYCLRETKIPHLKAVFAGSTLAKHLRILPLWILSPSDLRYPARYVRPVVNPWRAIYSKTDSSNSVSGNKLKFAVLCKPYDCTLR